MPGLELGGLFYREHVRPFLASAFPALGYDAALIGTGSEVLGYDTARSTDHDWGPRLQIFLAQEDAGRYAAEIVERLRWTLPRAVRGYSTHFGAPDAEGVRLAQERPEGPVEHRVAAGTVRDFFRSTLGVDPVDDLHAADWLCLPEQRLLELTEGRVFHDGLGELAPLRAKLAYYPTDVWLYRLAAQWKRISQEQPFVGRAGEVGDDLGSALVAARLVRDVMRLCFLMERRYAPYSKWFGTAFARLACGPALVPVLGAVVRAPSWREREDALVPAYETIARMHNALGLIPPVEARVSHFYSRPFRVINADDFVAALLEAITDPEVRAIPGMFGGVDQFADSTDLIGYPEAYAKLRVLYE